MGAYPVAAHKTSKNPRREKREKREMQDHQGLMEYKESKVTQDLLVP